MDHVRIMGFLFLLWTTPFALQFAEARLLDHHFSHHNSAATFDSGLDAVAVASSTAAGGHAKNYSESNRESNYGNSTHAANNTIITVELLQKEATPGDGSGSKAAAGIEEVAALEGNAHTLHDILKSHSSHTRVNDGIQGNVLSSSGRSPGVGHWEKSKSKSKYSTSPASNVLSSGPSPGVGNAHTSAVGVSQSESDTFNKLPSGPSPGVGHKVSNGYTEMAQAVSITQESKSKRKTAFTNILPSGSSPGVGNSATKSNGRKVMEKGAKDEEGMGIQTFPASNVLSSGPSPGVGNAHTSAVGGAQSQSGTFNKLPSGSSPGGGHKVTNGYTEKAQESESKKSATMNILPSGSSPGGGNSATNGRNTMETLITEKDEEGSGIRTFNRLPSGPSPGGGHSYTNADHVPENMKIASASEDRKSSDHIPIFHKLPGGPSPGGGHSSTDRTQLSYVAPVKTSSSPSPGDGNSSMNKLKAVRRSEKKKMEQTAGALDRNIGCDGGGLDFYGTLTPPMFGIATAGS